MRRNLAVWIVLLALLALTVGLAQIPMGWGNPAANLGIALAKAALVGLFFMELRGSPALIRLVFGIAVLTLVLLVVLSGADYLTRDLPSAPWQRPP